MAKARITLEETTQGMDEGKHDLCGHNYNNES